jgi:hypothetical protein
MAADLRAHLLAALPSKLVVIHGGQDMSEESLLPSTRLFNKENTDMVRNETTWNDKPTPPQPPDPFTPQPFSPGGQPATPPPPPGPQNK